MCSRRLNSTNVLIFIVISILNIPTSISYLQKIILRRFHRTSTFTTSSTSPGKVHHHGRNRHPLTPKHHRSGPRNRPLRRNGKHTRLNVQTRDAVRSPTPTSTPKQHQLTHKLRHPGRRGRKRAFIRSTFGLKAEQYLSHQGLDMVDPPCNNPWCKCADVQTVRPAGATTGASAAGAC